MINQLPFITLRMPAPVYFSIVGDIPLLRILGGLGMSDMNVRDGWDITIAVAYCCVSACIQRQHNFP